VLDSGRNNSWQGTLQQLPHSVSPAIISAHILAL
jgi:hypothetical protein